MTEAQYRLLVMIARTLINGSKRPKLPPLSLADAEEALRQVEEEHDPDKQGALYEVLKVTGVS
jgi:hypothetical protein